MQVKGTLPLRSCQDSRVLSKLLSEWGYGVAMSAEVCLIASKHIHHHY